MHRLLARITDPEEREKGFTLIELLVVIIIIGILAAIAIPIFLNQKQKAVDAGVKSDVRNAVSAVESAFTDSPNLVISTTTPPKDQTANFAIDSTGALVGAADTNPTIAKFVVTNGDKLTVAGGATGYCVYGDNGNGSTKNYWYDSTTGQISSTAPASGPCSGVS